MTSISKGTRALLNWRKKLTKRRAGCSMSASRRARDLLIQALPEKTPDGGLLESLGPDAATLLINGFVYEGRRITLKGAAGIWFPKGFSIPISRR